MLKSGRMMGDGFLGMCKKEGPERESWEGGRYGDLAEVCLCELEGGMTHFVESLDGAWVGEAISWVELWALCVEDLRDD